MLPDRFADNPALPASLTRAQARRIRDQLQPQNLVDSVSGTVEATIKDATGL
jgi:hypothetical protein